MNPAPAGRSSPPPPLGRRRIRNLHLPPRVQMKGSAYYYVYNGKWTPLGSSEPRMRALWAEMYDEAPAGVSVGDVVSRYIEREDRAASTLSQYRSYQRTLAEAFPIAALKLTSQHVAVWRESRAQRERKYYANGCITLLCAAFKWGDELGLSRPMKVSLYDVHGRDRYAEDWEVRAVRSKAKPWMQVCMDLGYMTAPRPSDLRALRWDAIRDGTIRFRTKKTGQRMAFRITPEIQEILDRARKRPIVGLFVVATDKGRPISRTMFQQEWVRARDAAGIADFQFRDIRAKSATDANEDGQDAQAMLGHSSAKMTETYLRKRRTIVVEPVRRKLKG